MVINFEIENDQDLCTTTEQIESPRHQRMGGEDPSEVVLEPKDSTLIAYITGICPEDTCLRDTTYRATLKIVQQQTNLIAWLSN
jgi:hypothetical protein